MTPSVAGLHHVALKTERPDRLAKFYRDVLGLQETARHVDGAGGLRSVWLRVGDGLLMVERSEIGGEPPEPDLDPPGLHLLAYRILPADRSAWIRRLAAEGCPVRGETAFSVYFADPDGHRFALSHWPEPVEEGT